jgi:hypothetical protein
MKNASDLTSRRDFLVKGALALPLVMAAGAGAACAADLPAPVDKTAAAPLPTRRLGKDGPQVCMMSLGGDYPAHSPEYLDLAWSMGVRYFDTAQKYSNGNDERHVADWLARYPDRRKELFLVSKDYPVKGPEQMLTMIDARLERCGTKYLDLFFIHQLCPQVYGPQSAQWPKSDAFKKVADQLKSSGKCRMVGFSCHGGPDHIMAAAEGGFVDAVMVQYSPFFTPGDAFDQALTACHQAGIGLIAMKTLRHAGEVSKRLPEFDKLGLTTHQALLHAVWSDPRISAVCTMPQNVGFLEESVAAARSYKEPLKIPQVALLKEAVLASGARFCPGCPACHEAAKLTEFAFQDIARFVNYYEVDGHAGARSLYDALPSAARNPGGLDLAELRERCAFRVDYPAIARRADRYFA